MHTIVSRMLHSAQFWESLNIRGRLSLPICQRCCPCSYSYLDLDAFLAQLQKQTASLDSVDLSATLTDLTATAPRLTRDELLLITSAYRVLLVTPPEYLPRSLHIELLKRGFAADVAVLLSLLYDKTGHVSERHLLVIREVLRRTISYLGVVESHVCSSSRSPFGCVLLMAMRLRFRGSSWTTFWGPGQQLRMETRPQRARTSVWLRWI